MAASERSVPEGWSTWPTISQAAALNGLSRKRVSDFLRAGALSKHFGPRGPQGGYRIDPEELEALLEKMSEAEDDGSEPSSAAPGGSMVADFSLVLRAQADGLRQAQAHNERLMTLFDEPYKHVLDTLRQSNAELRAELVAMRAERAAAEVQREESRSQRALEEIALTEVKAEANTKAEAFDLVKKLGTAMLNKHMGVDPRTVALQNALAAIPRESFEVLFKMGVLPPEAEAQLKVGLDWKDEPAAAPVPEAAQ